VFPDLSLTGLASTVESEAQREEASDLSQVRATANSVGQVVAGAAVGAVLQGNAQIDSQESNFGESINRNRADIEREGDAQRAAAAVTRAAAAALTANSTSDALQASIEPEVEPLDLNSTEALNDTLGVEDNQEPVESLDLNTTEELGNEPLQTSEAESSELEEGSADLISTDISTTVLSDTQEVADNPVPTESSELNVTDTLDSETSQANEEVDQSEDLEAASTGLNATDTSVATDETQSLPPDTSTETPAQTPSPLPSDDSDTDALSTPVPTSFFQVLLSSFLPPL